ncbi:MAG: LysM peptidoglycan-binding domain-containing protein [Bacteriovoracia bacterium]
MKTKPRKVLLAISTLNLLAASGAYAAKAPAISPEEEAAQLAKKLQPISDARWSEITGTKSRENYLITKGDTLYDVSTRLFGDGKYWPKIWSINNGAITNPHLIYPGNQVAFMPGTGTSLPTVAITALTQTYVDADIVIPKPPNGKVNGEWTELPRQRWETVSVQLPTGIDPQGFDSRSKIRFHESTGITLPSFAQSAELTSLGDINFSKEPSAGLSIGDGVYIEAKGDLQLGESYTVTQEPESLDPYGQDRSGYLYQNLGTVKVVGVRSNLFLGVITAASQPITRGTFIIPFIRPHDVPAPIPGSEPLEAEILIDRRSASYAIAENKHVFIDRGSDDGVQPGMVFRAYQNKDPGTKQEFPDANFVREADFLVIATTPQFSTALTIYSSYTIDDGHPVILLTDVSDVYGQRNTLGGGDDLDQLDPGGTLSDEERKELQQLEDWKGNPEEEALPEEDLDAPPVDEEAPTEAPAESALEEELPPLDDAPPPAEEVPLTSEPPAEEVPTDEFPADEPPPVEDFPITQ